MNSRESTELPPVESLDLEAQLEVSLALVKMRKRKVRVIEDGVNLFRPAFPHEIRERRFLLTCGLIPSELVGVLSGLHQCLDLTDIDLT